MIPTKTPNLPLYRLTGMTESIGALQASTSGSSRVMSATDGRLDIAMATRSRPGERVKDWLNGCGTSTAGYNDFNSRFAHFRSLAR